MISAADLRGDFTSGDVADKCRRLFHEPGCLSERTWRDEMNGDWNGDQEAQIGFSHVRAAEISESEGMTLDESHEGIDQIREKNRKGEDDEDGTGEVDDRHHEREGEDGSKDVDGAAIGECHGPPGNARAELQFG